MIRLPPDFSEFLRLLNSHGVEYLVIGGYAVAKHGYPRATIDLDVWISISDENANRVVAALQQFGFASPDVSPDLFKSKGRIVRMGVPPIRLKLLTTISGVLFEDCYPARSMETVEGVEIPFIGLAHLKINKRASGRHKDLNDLENLP